jgi:hypothetical protein
MFRSEPKKGEQKRLIAKAQAKRDQIKAANLSGLADPKVWTPVPHPSLSPRVSPRFDRDTNGVFQFMGRLTLEQLEAALVDFKQPVMNLMGTKFFGKSHILAAYVAKRMQAYFNDKNNERPILFLPKCGDLASAPTSYLKDAMLLAFAADDELLAEVAQLPEDTATQREWLEDKTFDLIADQGNDIQEKNTRLSDEEKKEARTIVASLTDIVSHRDCFALTGYSANNEIMQVLPKERSELDIEFYGGLEEKVRLLFSVCFD